MVNHVKNVEKNSHFAKKQLGQGFVCAGEVGLLHSGVKQEKEKDIIGEVKKTDEEQSNV
ncbi:hypothetical protein P4U90_10505 [Cytobacillus kochii]|uniref:hypothetical protein n=1 Tax=Cytobacillus kochii TaxID=859143 RepID=UPI002E250291|nr:hypothetical protein [Cytobacillus kochii]